MQAKIRASVIEERVKIKLERELEVQIKHEIPSWHPASLLLRVVTSVKERFWQFDTDLYTCTLIQYHTHSYIHYHTHKLMYYRTHMHTHVNTHTRRYTLTHYHKHMHTHKILHTRTHYHVQTDAHLTTRPIEIVILHRNLN